jgi:hypothetical protein
MFAPKRGKDPAVSSTPHSFRQSALEHRAEKWMPVFGKNDAKTKS